MIIYFSLHGHVISQWAQNHGEEAGQDQTLTLGALQEGGLGLDPQRHLGAK